MEKHEASEQQAEAILAAFEPSIAGWFASRFAAPTDVQTESWPRIAAGEHVLATAPTGSGKTVTLYTALNMLNQPEVNISTAEDPVKLPVFQVHTMQRIRRYLFQVLG